VIDYKTGRLDKNMAAAKVRIQLGPILNTLAPLAVAILIYVGGTAVIQGEITPGAFTAYAALLARLVWPTLTLGFMLALVQRGRASWTRLLQLQDTQPNIVDGPDALPASSRPVHVEVKELTIKIGERALVDRVSFELRPGTITAIVGRTGAGKSTLVDALCRLVEVPAGTIFFDGKDVTALTIASARAQIGYAPQEAFLFSGSVLENVRFPRPDASLEEVKRVARIVGAHDFIEALPDGYETDVQERGGGLSTGQRQLISFARALAHNPRFLILDEATSSVDTETEFRVRDALGRMVEGRTSIVIAHRLSTIQRANRILVMHKGRLRESGTRQELLAMRGIYWKLYQLQYKDQEAAAPQPHPSTAQQPVGD
jgi:ATP-binding cassette subfamily B protein